MLFNNRQIPSSYAERWQRVIKYTKNTQNIEETSPLRALILRISSICKYFALKLIFDGYTWAGPKITITKLHCLSRNLRSFLCSAHVAYVMMFYQFQHEETLVHVLQIFTKKSNLYITALFPAFSTTERYMSLRAPAQYANVTCEMKLASKVYNFWPGRLVANPKSYQGITTIGKYLHQWKTVITKFSPFF